MKEVTIRLAAGLFLAAAFSSAEAIPRLFSESVTQQQEASVRIGMTVDEVLALLGPPASDVKYRAAPGPSWAYYIRGRLSNEYSFEVQFDAAERVVSAGERYIPTGG